ncbi:MAG: TIR domain-containing protein [Lachnospiraceae bacterium]|nr:TIR domain-containing protein [Lachnospiraceae bacterium]
MAGTKSVFVSYSSQDHKLVNLIVNMMKDAGISYWKAPEMIPAGSSYAREIPRAIKECEVFLLVLSSTSQKSIWVEKETDSAISHRKTIIPFQIDDIPLNDTFRFYLNNVQMISYEQNGEEAMGELKQQLLDLLGLALIEDEAVPGVHNAHAKNPSADGGKVVVSTDTQLRGTLDEKSEDASGDAQFPRRSMVRKKADSNALRMNRIPLECDYCGSKLLENITMGTYRCVECGKDSYDDFQTIRNYLDKVGHAPAAVIERNTGVPKRVIEYFFRDEYLEIPIHSNVRVPCAKCGAPIRTGTLCDNCKKTGGPDKKSDMRKGSWHSLY